MGSANYDALSFPTERRHRNVEKRTKFSYADDNDDDDDDDDD